MAALPKVFTSFLAVTSRAVAMLLAASIATITTTFLSLIEGTPLAALMVAASLSFASSFILVYITFEFLIFREIEKVYSKIKEVSATPGQLPALQHITASRNPIKTVNQEIVTYVTKKEDEIDDLKQLEMYRREFIADISHELRTPIFAAQGYILTLQDGAINDKKVRMRFLKKAAKSLNRLDALVRDLLTLSKMESGVTAMHYQIFDLQAHIIDAFEQFEAKSKKKNIMLNLPQPHEEGVYVRADPDRIMQVLDNLINNAIIYGHEGGWVEVTFQVEAQYILTTIRDNGPGIPPEHVARIFERFYRVDKSRNKKQGGSGLGLAIVKHIIEGHGTTIQIDSKVNEGTAFSFRLEKAE
jgi:two-component system phosphate regulon sensor histidine kinase PhoR